MSESVSPTVPPEPLAVIGLSCLFPQAADAGAFWSNIRRGVDAITEIPASHWNPDAYFDADPKSPDMTYARRGGFLSPVEFDPLEFGIAPSNLEAIDTSQLLGLVGAKRALEDAGYGADREFDRSRIGCILGVTGTLEMVIPLGARLGHPKWRQALKDAGVADDVAEDVIERISDSYVPWQENSFPGLLGNVVAGRIANRLDLGGTNCVVDAACASSLSAIHLAALELWSGRSEMVVTGGIDTFNDIFMFMCFSKTPALSPTGDAKPFSDTGDGTILGEGVGMIVLKRLRDAQRDGDKVYALIRGIGTSSDGAGNAVYAPKQEGQVRCLQDAYRLAGVSPDTVELIEAHGTGTKVGDATELAGLTEVFQSTGRTDRWCAVGSVKSQIGHTKAAAGAAGILKAILALRHHVLPPTIKIERPLVALREQGMPLYANTLARPWLPAKTHPRRAGVSAFGFGGSNFHCVLEESPASEPEIDWDDDVFFAAWSAESREQLAAQLAEWSGVADRREMLQRAAQSRRRFDPAQPHRLAIVADARTADLAQLVSTAGRNLTAYADRGHRSTPEGLFYGSGPRAGKLGLLFPGQGSQYVNMQRELACRFPMLQQVLAEANEVYETFAAAPKSPRLSESIYPLPAFDDATRERQEASLRATEIAQPALGAVSLGLLAVLAEFGVSADVVAGHSYGELTALCVSKRFAPEALYRLSMLRGRLMAEAQEVAGGMLAVGAPLSQVEAALKEAAVDLVIANRNSPTQVVLSGRVAELERADTVLARKNIRGKRLPVAAAFHSPLVAAASSRFRPELDEVAFLTPEIPVYGNTLAEEYPLDADEARSLIAGQLAQPVEFVRQIENMAAAGVNTFLEVGPGAVLTGLVNSILSGREFRAIAVDSSTGKRSGMLDLALALGQLGVAGQSVSLSNWDPRQADVPALATNGSPRLTIPICGANYVKPRTPRPPREVMRRAPEAREALRSEDSASRLTEDFASRPNEQVVVTPRLAATQTSPPALLVLQQMYEQTARLHQQFLTGQERALETLERLAGGSRETRVERQEPQRQPALRSEDSAARRTEVPTTQPVVAAQLASTQQPVDTQLMQAVLAVVAEKTGYPAEMLKPEMSLDHDLGIDSIKRVEILSALQERRPDLPAVKPEQLGTLHRLSDVIALLEESQESRDKSQEPERQRALRSGDSASRLTAAVGTQPSTLNSQLIQVVLAVVAEKTGYPAEMLKPEMSLDHDLGIDSIKRVEILSALQERRPDLPAVKPEQLGTLHRLSDVIALLDESQETRDMSQEPERQPTLHFEDSASRRTATADSRLIVRVPRATALTEAGRSLNIPAGATFLITDDGSELSLRMAARLTALGYRPRLVRLDDPASHAVPDDLAGLILLAPERGLTDAQLWKALEWTQKCGPVLRRAGKLHGSILATISRQNGQFGFPASGSSTDPLSGALAGLAKTARHEWPEVTATAVDLAADVVGNREVANQLVDRLLTAGPAEIGVTAEGWRQIDVHERSPAEPGEPPVRPGELVLVTGGARGVTAACALAVAQAWKPRLILCGRTPLGTTEPAWLAGLVSPNDIKLALVSRAAPGASPRQVEQQCRQVLANREIRSTLESIRTVGAEVEYLALDLRDQIAVQQTLRDVQQRHGPIRGVIHGAGVLEDRRIEDKTREQFDHVFSTKIAGWRNVLGALDPDALRFLAVFSSFTGRFGRTGQVDYAMANEALNKLAQQFQARHPSCRTRSFNWGPWDGGMVTPALKPLFEKEGVGLIPLEAGANLLVRELERADSSAVEIVVLAEQTGGGALRSEDFASRLTVPVNPQPTSGRCGWERTVDVPGHPYLESHVIGGKAVFPTAMIMECLAHAALHHHPGLEFVGLSNLRIFKGVRLARQERVTLRAMTEKTLRAGGDYRIPTRLISRDAERDVVHAEAEIVLSAERSVSTPNRLLPVDAVQALMAPKQWYGDLLFHGPQLHGLTKIESLTKSGIVVQAQAAPVPADWLSDPWRGAWLADPLVLDVALQAIIVWTQTVYERASLPTAIAGYRQFRRSFPRDGLKIAIRAERRNEATVTADAEVVDAQGNVVAELTGVEYVLDAQLSAAFTRNRLE